MIVEDVEFRVWAALRPVHAATRRPVLEPLLVRGAGQNWRCNRSGLLVLHELREPGPRRDELVAYEASFEIPTAVAPPLAITATLEDPRRQLLARRFAVTLPRAHTAAPGVLPPLFEPLEVPMYPAPHAPLAAPWALVRVHVERGGAPAKGCVLTVHEPGDATRVLGRGQSDSRGEAVVAVPGVPAFIPSGGPDAFVRERTVAVTVVFEPAATLPPDTDALAEASGAGFVRTTVNASIASGRSTPLAVVLP